MKTWNVCHSVSLDQNQQPCEESWSLKSYPNFCLIQDGVNSIILLSICLPEPVTFKSVCVNKLSLMVQWLCQLPKDWLSLMLSRESKCSKIWESQFSVSSKIWLTMNVVNAELRIRSSAKATQKWWWNSSVLR